MTDSTDAVLDPFDQLYARCLGQIRTIAAMDPATGPEGWDTYTCTCANEFALDLAHIAAADSDDHLQVLDEVMHGYMRRNPTETDPDESEYPLPLDTPSSLITYGLASFANVLRHIERLRDRS